MCYYPRLVKNPKYMKNKKNRGIIPPVFDTRVLHVAIGCGQCMECRKQKARSWQSRLLEDLSEHKNGKFVTLTFSNNSIRELAKECQGLKGYELDNAIATLGVRRFLERWRKQYKKSVRHWFVTELGHNGTENIHLHGIIWTNEHLDEVERIWKYGWIWKGKQVKSKSCTRYVQYVSEKTINYVVKYVNKIDFKHKYYKSKILTSAGIGKCYTKRSSSRLNKYKGKDTIETYRTKSGHQINMPIYWRNKIYSDRERELLWIHKLDEQVRWVNGVKIDVSKNDNDYWKALREARKLNVQLGYGNGDKSWSRLEYETARREMMMNKRTMA